MSRVCPPGAEPEAVLRHPGGVVVNHVIVVLNTAADAGEDTVVASRTGAP